jgi:ABC-2 type transport system ATP-binding protein
MTEAAPAVMIDRLSKDYGNKLALDQVSLEIPQGAYYGVVGPNGAGKTTMLMCLCGLLRPTAGAISVNGLDVWSNLNAVKAHLGIMPTEDQMFNRLSGLQLLMYAGLLRSMDKRETLHRAEELIEAFGLEDGRDRLVIDYSTGMKKKIALATSLIHQPDTLVLDEPFEAVDPVSVANIKTVLDAFIKGGGTIIISSHVMEQVETICSHVCVINEGRVKAAGTLDEVRNGESLEQRFLSLVGGVKISSGLEWLNR